MFTDPPHNSSGAKLTPGAVLRPRLNREYERAQLTQVLDLIFQDSELNVYAGEREVRPPRAPTKELSGAAAGSITVWVTIRLASASRRAQGSFMASLVQVEYPERAERVEGPAFDRVQ